MSKSTTSISISRFRFWVEGISMLLFLAALTQPAFCTNMGNDNCIESLQCLLLGWGGLFYHITSIAWLANPLVIVAWAMAPRKTEIALAAAVPACLLALSFLYFDELVVSEGRMPQLILSYELG